MTKLSLLERGHLFHGMQRDQRCIFPSHRLSSLIRVCQVRLLKVYTVQRELARNKVPVLPNLANYLRSQAGSDDLGARAEGVRLSLEERR